VCGKTASCASLQVSPLHHLIKGAEKTKETTREYSPIIKISTTFRLLAPAPNRPYKKWRISKTNYIKNNHT
jgi:hypothetical protein